MPCSTLIDPACIVSGITGGIAGAASSGFLSALANGVRSALDWMFTNTVTLWLKIPDLYPAGEAPALHRVQDWLFLATAAVAVGGAIAAGARMALTRKHAPLLDLTGGLAVIGLAAALGIAAPTALMKATDAWTQWVLAQATGGDVTGRLNALLGSGYGSGIPDVAVIVFGSIATVASGIQALLLLFREAAILVLAAVLPLAAAGAIAPATRGWIKKIASWMLALILYPAAAACVYATGFTMLGSATGVRALLIGFAMIVLSVVALPVLMKFFTWTTGAVSSGCGGAGQFLGLAAAGALGLGALRGGPSTGSSAAQQAQYMNQSNPPPGGPPSGPSGGPGATGPSRTPGPSGSTGLSGAPGSGAASSGNSGSSAPGSSVPDAAAQGGPRRLGGGPGARPESDAGSPGAGQTAAGGPAARQGTGSGPGGASGAATPGPTVSSSGAAMAGGKAGAAAKTGPAAAGFAALFAAQAMASGAKNAAAGAMEPEERS